MLTNKIIGKTVLFRESLTAQLQAFYSYSNFDRTVCKQTMKFVSDTTYYSIWSRFSLCFYVA